MKISFEFNIGDEVWLMHKNKAKSTIIKEAFYYQHKDSFNSSKVIKGYYYTVYDKDGKEIGRYEPKVLFRTKAELIQSL